jgi:hypothetical protein
METVDPKYLTAWRNRFAMRDSESSELATRLRTELAGAVEILRKYVDVDPGGLINHLNLEPLNGYEKVVAEYVWNILENERFFLWLSRRFKNT